MLSLFTDSSNIMLQGNPYYPRPRFLKLYQFHSHGNRKKNEIRTYVFGLTR